MKKTLKISAFLLAMLIVGCSNPTSPNSGNSTSGVTGIYKDNPHYVTIPSDTAMLPHNTLVVNQSGQNLTGIYNFRQVVGTSQINNTYPMNGILTSISDSASISISNLDTASQTTIVLTGKVKFSSDSCNGYINDIYGNHIALNLKKQ